MAHNALPHNSAPHDVPSGFQRPLGHPQPSFDAFGHPIGVPLKEWKRTHQTAEELYELTHSIILPENKVEKKPLFDKHYDPTKWHESPISYCMGKVILSRGFDSATGSGMCLFDPLSSGTKFEAHICFKEGGGPFQSLGFVWTDRTYDMNPTHQTMPLCQPTLKGFGLQVSGEVVRAGVVIDKHKFLWDHDDRGIKMSLNADEGILEFSQPGCSKTVVMRGVHGTLTPMVFLDDSNIRILKASSTTRKRQVYIANSNSKSK